MLTRDPRVSQTGSCGGPGFKSQRSRTLKIGNFEALEVTTMCFTFSKTSHLPLFGIKHLERQVEWDTSIWFLKNVLNLIPEVLWCLFIHTLHSQLRQAKNSKSKQISSQQHVFVLNSRNIREILSNLWYQKHKNFSNS